MNFYKHYMGDYQRDTKHLTIAQDGAYRRLLDHYYATKKALPNDHETLCRVAGAISQQDQAAVKFVISEFFKAGEDGLLHNKRADQEIVKADEYSESQRRRINKRWGKDTGVIPGNNPESYPEDTSHSHSHNHIPKTKAKALKSKTQVAAMPLPDWLDGKTWTEWLKVRKAKSNTPGSLQAALKKLEGFKDAGFDPNEIVANSLANGWQGLFPPAKARANGTPDYSGVIANLRD